jgi:hypothetical protein
MRGQKVFRSTARSLITRSCWPESLLNNPATLRNGATAHPLTRIRHQDRGRDSRRSGSAARPNVHPALISDRGHVTQADGYGELDACRVHTRTRSEPTRTTTPRDSSQRGGGSALLRMGHRTQLARVARPSMAAARVMTSTPGQAVGSGQCQCPVVLRTPGWVSRRSCPGRSAAGRS